MNPSSIGLVAVCAGRVLFAGRPDCPRLPDIVVANDEADADAAQRLLRALDLREARVGRLLSQRLAGPSGAEWALRLYEAIVPDEAADAPLYWGGVDDLAALRQPVDAAAVRWMLAERATAAAVDAAVRAEREATLQEMELLRAHLAERETPRTVAWIRKHGWPPSVKVGDCMVAVRNRPLPDGRTGP